MQGIFRKWFGAALVLGLVGCGGDDPTGPVGAGNGAVSATVAGSAWSAAFVQAIRNSGAIGVGATSAGGITLGFGFVEAGPGTYAIGTTGTSGTVTDGAGNTWAAGGSFGSGAIVVTSIDSDGMTGTFSFTGELTAGSGAATSAVTNGTFDVDFD